MLRSSVLIVKILATLAMTLHTLGSMAFAQRMEVGVKGGVPLLDAFHDNASVPFFRYSFDTKRYTVGPTVDLALPLNFRFEVDALYTRLDYNATTMGVDTFTREATRANSWTLPFLLMKTFHPGSPSAFGGAGYALRHVSGRSHIVNTILPLGSFAEDTSPPELTHSWTNGFVAATGLRFRTASLRLTPELRYIRWFDPMFRSAPAAFQSNANEFTFLLGLSWSLH